MLNRKKYTVGIGLLIAALLYMGTSSAAVLEQIIVTAQKRQQNLQDVGISVTAFTGNEITKLGFTDPTDLAAQTPGLTYQNENPGAQTIFVMRGISQRDFSDHHEPPVAYYVDGAYVSNTSAVEGQMYDVQRVEILRGPQGTLFGRNSTGGLIQLITKKPTANFDLYGDFTYGSYNQKKFEGAVGGALISDRVLGRLSVAEDFHDGWMKNRIGRNLLDKGEYSGRLQLLFKLTDNAQFLLKVHHTEDHGAGGGFTHTPNAYGPNMLGYIVGRNELATYYDFNGNPFQTCPGCDGYFYKEPDTNPRTGSFNTDCCYARGLSGVTGKLTVDFHGMTLTALTDYLVMNKNLTEDIDSSPLPSIDYYYDDDLKQFSQELRLNGQNGPLRWITGLYYLNIRIHSAAGIPHFNIAPFVGVHVPGVVIPFSTYFTAQTDTTSWAIFGHLEYAFNDQWSVIAALRYTEDRLKADYTLRDTNYPVPTFQQFNPQTAPNAKLFFGNVSAKLELDWKPNPDTLLYASYTRGHKAGGFSYPFLGPVDFSVMSHKQEVVNSYEAGFKSEFLDHRVRLNADVWYYDYKDFQASFFVNFADIVGNLDATLYGSEIELTAQVTDQLKLSLGTSLLHTVAKNVGMPDGSIQDRRMANAPDYTFNGLAVYTIPLSNGADVALQMDFNYKSKYCFSVVCNPSEKVGAYVVGNARVSYTTADQRWTVSGFVHNLADVTYRVSSSDSAFATLMTNLPNPPRWFGGSVAFHWK